MNPLIKRVQSAFSQDLTTTMLRIAVVVWALVITIAAFSIENKWILAGLLAWEILP